MSSRAASLAGPSDVPLDRLLWARPLVPLAGALVLGVALADALQWPPWVWALVMLPCLLGALLPPTGHLPGLALLAASLALAGLLHALRLTPAAGDVSRLIGSSPPFVTARVGLPVPGWRPHIALESVTVRDVSGRVWPCPGGSVLQLPCGVESPPAGALVALTRPAIVPPPGPTNWFQRDRRPALARRGIHSLMIADAWTLVAPPPSGLARAAGQWRAAAARLLRASVSANHRDPDAAILVGMVLGDQAASLDPDVVEAFRRTGTIHLLVVSGAQVSVLMVFLVSLLRTGGRLGLWQSLAVAVALAWFGMVVGMGASVARSLVMAAVWMLATLSGRRYDLASGVALAAIVLILSDTSVVFGIGAQLTFAATLGVVLGVGATRPGNGLFGPPPRSRADDELALAGLGFTQVAGRALGRALGQAAAGTAGAWLLTTPLLAYHFSSFSLLGSLANLIAVPLAGIIVVIGLLIVTLGALVPPLAPLLGWVAWAAVWLVHATVSLCDRLPLACLDNLHFPLPAAVLWLTIGGALAWGARSARAPGARGRAAAVVLTGAAIVAALTVAVSLLLTSRPVPLRITALDVGEGQCTVVETPARRVIVFDAGGRFRYTSWAIAREVLIPYLVGRGHRFIDALVLSHADVDHTGAVAPLARRMPVTTVLLGGGEGGETYRKGLQALRDAGASIQCVAAGSSARVGDATLQFAWPPRNAALLAAAPGSSNNTSVVSRLSCAGVTALLPGDLETPALDALLSAWPPGTLKADYLQVPHHGRASAASPAFYAAVSPAVAVVSRAGEPRWRHGQDLAARAGSALYSTEQGGAVCVQTTPHGLRVETFLRKRSGP